MRKRSLLVVILLALLIASAPNAYAYDPNHGGGGGKIDEVKYDNGNHATGMSSKSGGSYSFSKCSEAMTMSTDELAKATNSYTIPGVSHSSSSSGSKIDGGVAQTIHYTDGSILNINIKNGTISYLAQFPSSYGSSATETMAWMEIEYRKKNGHCASSYHKGNNDEENSGTDGDGSGEGTEANGSDETFVGEYSTSADDNGGDTLEEVLETGSQGIAVESTDGNGTTGDGTEGKGEEKKEPETYTVVKGDCLWKIAQKYGCTVEDLLEANPWIVNKDLIYVDQVITIPTKEGDETGDKPADSNAKTEGEGTDANKVNTVQYDEKLAKSTMDNAIARYTKNGGSIEGKTTEQIVDDLIKGGYLKDEDWMAMNPPEGKTWTIDENGKSGYTDEKANGGNADKADSLVTDKIVKTGYKEVNKKMMALGKDTLNSTIKGKSTLKSNITSCNTNFVPPTGIEAKQAETVIKYSDGSTLKIILYKESGEIGFYVTVPDGVKAEDSCAVKDRKQYSSSVPTSIGWETWMGQTKPQTTSTTTPATEEKKEETTNSTAQQNYDAVLKEVFMSAAGSMDLRNVSESEYKEAMKAFKSNDGTLWNWTDDKYNIPKLEKELLEAYSATTDKTGANRKVEEIKKKLTTAWGRLKSALDNNQSYASNYAKQKTEHQNRLNEIVAQETKDIKAQQDAMAAEKKRLEAIIAKDPDINDKDACKEWDRAYKALNGGGRLNEGKWNFIINCNEYVEPYDQKYNDAIDTIKAQNDYAKSSLQESVNWYQSEVDKWNRVAKIFGRTQY